VQINVNVEHFLQHNIAPSSFNGDIGASKGILNSWKPGRSIG
jgi:hypothetical protein